MTLISAFFAFFLGSNATAKDFTFAVIGDAGLWNANTESVRNSIVKENVTDLVLLGDNRYRWVDTLNEIWSPWTEKGLHFEVVTIGNHHAPYHLEVKFFKMPEEYYSKVYGDKIRFIVLNSDNIETAAKQITWLQKELDQAKEKFIFLVYHHPTYTISKKHDWDERKLFQEKLRPVIWKNRSKLTALLNGHDHQAQLLEFNDLPIVINGATQEVRNGKATNNLQAGVKVKTTWYFDSKPYWVRLKITEKDLATVEFIRASDSSVRCTSTLITGKPALLEANCGKNDERKK